MRRQIVRAIILLSAVILLFFAVSAAIGYKKRCDEEYRPDSEVTLADKKFRTEIAASDEDRSRGLSGRKCIGENQAMLFEFSQPGKPCFWMKDMKFAIDIIWFDEAGSIVYAKEDARPDSYPETFCPQSDSVRVIELRQGTIDRLGLDLTEENILKL
jgi:uncharacterized membrane protein (UPF0127 family)